MRIGQRVSQRVTGRITARLLGRVGTELIPIVGWIIGTGLIVYDVVDSLDGALPQIEESLKEEEIKATIRAEIGATVAPELRQELPLLAREISNDLYTAWLDFRRKYRQVLTLADENPAFNEILAQSNDLANAAEWVDATLGAAGRSALDAAIADGSLAVVLGAAAGRGGDHGAKRLVSSCIGLGHAGWFGPGRGCRSRTSQAPGAGRTGPGSAAGAACTWRFRAYCQAGVADAGGTGRVAGHLQRGLTRAGRRPYRRRTEPPRCGSAGAGSDGTQSPHLRGDGRSRRHDLAGPTRGACLSGLGQGFWQCARHFCVVRPT